MQQSLFSANDYAILSEIVFKDDYPGYRPEIIESPNGDGNLDDKKLYAHIAKKYLDRYDVKSSKDVLQSYLNRAHEKSIEVAVALGVPKKFWPNKNYSCLRVLEYGPAAITHPHYDFDLFTLMCYRNLPEYFRYVSEHMENSYNAHESSNQNAVLRRAQALNSQIHFGEILQALDTQKPGERLWKATKHEVIASNGPSQYSIVYFTIPDESAVLPEGRTVKALLEERLSRSRYDKK